MSDDGAFLEIRNKLEQEAIGLLDTLADSEDQLEVLRLRHEEVMDALIPQELKDEAKRLRALYAVQTEGLVTEVGELKGKIEIAALALGHTVRGGRKQVVWNKPRSKWDQRALTAYAETHPEVAALKTLGNPYVSFRKTGGKG